MYLLPYFFVWHRVGNCPYSNELKHKQYAYHLSEKAPQVVRPLPELTSQVQIFHPARHCRWTSGRTWCLLWDSFAGKIIPTIKAEVCFCIITTKSQLLYVGKMFLSCIQDGIRKGFSLPLLLILLPRVKTMKVVYKNGCKNRCFIPGKFCAKIYRGKK